MQTTHCVSSAGAPGRAPTRIVPRIAGLDSLRGLAALSVVMYHYTDAYNHVLGQHLTLWFDFKRGNLGVDAFFVISGFVIFMTLDKSASAADFMVSRFSRLFPAYWFCLVCTYVGVGLSGLPRFHYPLADFAANFTMVQQVLGFSHIDGVYWTLQLELVFYGVMLLAWQLGALKRSKLLILSGLLVSTCGLLIARREPALADIVFSDVSFVRFIPLFAIGMVMYRAHRDGSLSRDDVVILTLCVVARFSANLLWAGAVASAMCVALILLSRAWLRLDHKALVWLGGISYPLYLIHQHLGYVVIFHLAEWGVDPNVAVAVAIALAVWAGWAISRHVERPLQARIRTAWARRQQGLPRTAP